jgi:hypothetical protein
MGNEHAMTRTFGVGSWAVTLLLGLAALGCEPGGVGDPCVPEDEYEASFAGFQVTEVNVESRSFQCETRVCLVNHFQGRVSCPKGQTETEAGGAETPCAIPATGKTGVGDDRVTVRVSPQLTKRQTDDAVYCSCRCNGPDENARYCECPDGFACEELVKDLKIGESGGQLAGSYCIREGSRYDSAEHVQGDSDNCSASPAACGLSL